MADDANWISELDEGQPTGQGPAGEGDDELVTLKRVLQNSFGGKSGDTQGLDGKIYNEGGTESPTAAEWSALFTRVAALEGTTGAIGSVPLGAIVAWNQPTIPTGWALCDGNGGVPINSIAIPDYRDQFLYGAGGSEGLGNTGGSPPGSQTTDPAGAHTHTGGGHALTAAELPANMGIEITLSDSGQADDHSRTNSVARGNYDTNSDYSTPIKTPLAVGASHSHGATSENGSHTHTLGATSLPPYLAQYFIIYVGE
jgi:hypothetical protein